MSFQSSAQRARAALCPTFQKADFVETESHRSILSAIFFFFGEGKGGLRWWSTFTNYTVDKSITEKQ